MTLLYFAQTRRAQAVSHEPVWYELDTQSKRGSTVISLFPAAPISS